MNDDCGKKLVYWPFLLVDLLFAGAAGVIFKFAHRPLELPEIYALILCVFGGAWAFLIPFRVRLKMAEREQVAAAVEQIKNIEAVAAQITSATNLWQNVQEESAKTAAAAKEVGDRIQQEAKEFTEFMQQANDREKSHLRLEVEKWRRAENEWVGALVYILDHVYALHRGAVESRNPALAGQIGHFQSACREPARRMGLALFEAAADEGFDPEKHQISGDAAAPDAGTPIADTLAPGYLFQGRLIRRALVRLKTDHAEEAEVENAAEESGVEIPENRQNSLPI